MAEKIRESFKRIGPLTIGMLIVGHASRLFRKRVVCDSRVLKRGSVDRRCVASPFTFKRTCCMAVTHYKGYCCVMVQKGHKGGEY